MPGARSSSPAVIEVGDADFEHEVLERSRALPVVVDFWAPWCGPCRALGPLLEQLAHEHAGEFVLAKVNVDESPVVAQQLGVRSIPAVFGFRDGAIAARFVGAQPPLLVRRFLAELLPGEADRGARAGFALLEQGDHARAEGEFRAALAEQARHPRALLGLARVHAARGEREEALDALERITGEGEIAAEVARLAAELRTAAGGVEEGAALRQRLAADPGDLGARLELGRALASQRRWEEALRELLAVVRADPKFADEAARLAMLDIFAVLGPRHATTEQFRAELAKALFR